MCVGLAIGVSFGLSSAFGVFYSPIHSTLPFLLLGKNDIPGQMKKQVLCFPLKAHLHPRLIAVVCFCFESPYCPNAWSDWLNALKLFEKAAISSCTRQSEWRRANARNVSFSISVRWSIYIINSVDKPNFRVLLPHRRSTTVSSETNPPTTSSGCLFSL